MRDADFEGLNPEAGAILFFDGACILCNGFADLVLRRDRARRFRFATLQGDTAARVLGRPESDLTSVVLREGGREYRKSEAVLRVLPRLGGFYRLAPALRVAPRPLRDALYDLVARNRLRWFGARSCRMPTAAERGRFLP